QFPVDNSSSAVGDRWGLAKVLHGKAFRRGPAPQGGDRCTGDTNSASNNSSTSASSTPKSPRAASSASPSSRDPSPLAWYARSNGTPPGPPWPGLSLT